MPHSLIPALSPEPVCAAWPCTSYGFNDLRLALAALTGDVCSGATHRQPSSHPPHGAIDAVQLGAANGRAATMAAEPDRLATSVGLSAGGGAGAGAGNAGRSGVSSQLAQRITADGSFLTWQVTLL